jgi:hypothetical protein
MSATALMQPEMIPVNRSELRQKQSALLRRARGRTVLLVKANLPEEEKIVLDKEYFDQMRQKFESLIETLEIAMDRRLFNQILTAADTLEEDLRLGKLNSLEDAFGEL